MGIFGAMTTAITGIQAQSFALERISDNIANSQTTGYKRSDAAFADFVPDSPSRQQALGVVNAFSRPTNTIQGDIANSEVRTHMAVNGDGYFIISQQTDTIDGLPVFGSENLYTRRGDFEFDQNGYLVNAAGYFLNGLPIDPTTGNPSGSSPDVIRISNDFIPAQATTEIDYRANLADYPLTASANPAIPGSELINPDNFSVDPTVGGAGVVQANEASTFIDQSISGGAITAYDAVGASVNVQFRWAKTDGPITRSVHTGTAVANPADLTAGMGGAYNDGTNTADTLTITVGGTNYNFVIGTGGGEVSTLTDLVNAINGTANLNTSITASATGGALQIRADDYTTSFTIGGDADAVAGLGLTANTYSPGTSTTDTWNLFYLTDSNATGTQTAWRNVGVDYVFGSNGQLSPPITTTTISGLTVNGINLGNITLDHGSNGITQFADSNGVAKVTDINQDGFAAGELVGITVSDEGRVVASYTNGRAVDLYEVTLASFNGDGGLAKTDGGAFRATPDSGAPILGSLGSVVGQALEGSNTDIADEFSKLIVTQQAYAANTRIISTADEMVQEALNMVR
ncbi:MAG: hypothetical protein Kow0032_24780 [Methyloligellaceae bacterium]